MKRALSLILTLLLLGALGVRTAAVDEEVRLLALAADAVAPDGAYTVRLAVCAALINRKNAADYPKSLAAVICDAGISLPDAASATPRSLRAAADALDGCDPTHGAVRFSHAADEHSRVRLALDGFFFY